MSNLIIVFIFLIPRFCNQQNAISKPKSLPTILINSFFRSKYLCHRRESDILINMRPFNEQNL